MKVWICQTRQTHEWRLFIFCFYWLLLTFPLNRFHFFFSTINRFQVHLFFNWLLDLLIHWFFNFFSNKINMQIVSLCFLKEIRTFLFLILQTNIVSIQTPPARERSYYFSFIQLIFSTVTFVELYSNLKIHAILFRLSSEKGCTNLSSEICKTNKNI